MWLSILIPIMLSILVIVCALLILVVLMQRPKNEGLGAAFGSSMTENIFGAQTATVLTKATVYLGCIFFAVTLLLTVLTARQSMQHRVGVLENEVRKTAVLPTPTATTSPAGAVSPQASATVSASVTPAVSSTPVASPTPVASASPKSSSTPAATPAPSSTPAPEPSATAAQSPEQSSPAPSVSPQP
jgi:preprotein translocase subunit SecG